jgi:ubiquinone/menaquinone biosynthesis C-methylase UbiE
MIDMNLIEVLVIVLCSIALIILVSGLFRLNIPRRINLEGIEDPKAAEAYDRVSRMPQFKLIRRSFVKKLRKYSTKETITDIGCGPGYLLQTISKEFPENKLVGVDISKEMVEKAKANLASMGYSERIEFRQGAADCLPFDDDTQDFIVSTFSLHHWADPEASFKEIYRVLKPGGQILIFDFRRDSRRLLFYLMWFAQNVALRIIGLTAIRRINEPIGSLLASYSKKEIGELIKNTPFKDYEVEGKLGWIYLYGKKAEIAL